MLGLRLVGDTEEGRTHMLSSRGAVSNIASVGWGSDRMSTYLFYGHL